MKLRNALVKGLLVFVLSGAGGIGRGQDVAGQGSPAKTTTRTLSVSGNAELSAAPDIAVINVGVMTQGKTAREALSANTELSLRLRATLKERGIAERDIQTSQLNINAQFSQPAPAPPGRQMTEFIPRIVGYNVNNTVQVISRDLAKLGEMLDATVTAGANQVYGIQFQVNGIEKFQDQLRKKAMADAKRKAELIAGEAGLVLGLPILIQESGGFAPMPMMVNARFAAMDMAPAPIAPGEQKINLNINVTYELHVPK